MAQKNVTFNDFQELVIDRQKAALRLNGGVTITNFKKIPNTFISVGLSGTTVAADHNGEMTYDSDDKKGYYLDRFEVNVLLDSPDYYVSTDAPTTTMGSGATTSSAQLALNLSAGTFGPVPTTGIGEGVAIGESFTANLTDWRVENHSENNAVRHVYYMAACGGGAHAYNRPEDLVDTSFEGGFKGAPLLAVPHLSIANMPLIDTGIFVSREQQLSDVTLRIVMRAHFVYVEKTFELFVVKIDTKGRTWTYEYDVKLPVSQVVPD
ncbi:hypothetical protein [Sphaerisporangium fuscum]|uniref:hypothetical protein n=1 Tax=Sphaerisporangium fuscum TaxID=2835868 RepID=UPI001BDD0299|nr:hypothetical protein [Sphaerisporangium fuscum]